jgi:hypothetical protein
VGQGCDGQVSGRTRSTGQADAQLAG